ncbi:hypothetical protein B0H17DRAFT_1212936 [Mycena rosella]|uniref:F-box domain-containing protein n=1 Tax=Mycena rosella TaxID=1033263 RepID=A0AAD7G1W8_MYCRO|nr:hypothetical protein B0H17DRAFT_1212936 [Mycena rosella]
MSVIAELEALIEMHSADMAQQEDSEILKTLKKTRSALQRQLNAVCDPMERLPLEISSEIFTQCLPSHPTPGADSIPMRFLNICSAWTHIALSTPALWAAIDIVCPSITDSGQALGTWLNRARDLPLSVSLRTSFEEGVATIAISVRPLSPTLKLDFLRCAPNLVECTFDNFLLRGHKPEELPELVLRNLRHLRFGKFSDDPFNPALHDSNNDRHLVSDPQTLKYLTLPALETLYLPDTPPYLLSFLDRSSPPLRTLALGRKHTSIQPPDLIKCLRFVPTLTHLDLYRPVNRYVLDTLFAALTDLPLLLPNLHTLRIYHFHSRLFRDSLETLLRALTARRTQIVCFELVWSWGEGATADASCPPADIGAALGELVADGMSIRFGTEDSNFMDSFK